MHKPVIAFDEDNFDTEKHSKAAVQAKLRKSGLMLARRQVRLGKRIVSIVGLILFVLLWFVINSRILV